MSAERRERILLGLAVATGIVLFAIGIRFIAAPQAATRFFGIGDSPALYDLHYVIGLRDLWLALLVVLLALLREWRALALWLGLGALVCLADGWVAAGSSGRIASVLFHVGSGAFCAVLGTACWREASRRLST